MDLDSKPVVLSQLTQQLTWCSYKFKIYFKIQLFGIEFFFFFFKVHTEISYLAGLVYGKPQGVQALKLSEPHYNY